MREMIEKAWKIPQLNPQLNPPRPLTCARIGLHPGVEPDKPLPYFHPSQL
jgi:hypothetical protein